MIHITKYLVSIKLHFVCFLIGFLLFMNIFYFYYFIPMAKRNRESPLKCLQDLVNVIKQDQITVSVSAMLPLFFKQEYLALSSKKDESRNSFPPYSRSLQGTFA